MCYTEYGRTRILEETEGYAGLHEFTAALLDAIETSHIADTPWPLTVRHAAHHLPPDSIGEGVVDKEYKVFQGFRVLAGIGILEAAKGPYSKVRCDGDYLPVFVLKVPAT